jgi:prepilin-type N-terminal cleavage/methylation domain-containing protein
MKILKSNKGFTLVEVAVVIAIVAAIVAIAIPFLGSSKQDSGHKAADATAKTINEAIIRAKLKGDTNPAIVGPNANDITNAVNYLLQQGYIQ